MGVIEEIADTWSLKTHGGFWSRFVYVCLCVYLYATNTNAMSRSVGLIGACAVLFVETGFTTIGHSVKKKSFAMGHTTWAQFVCNILYVPVLLVTYRHVVENFWYRVILFPINIWLLEIIQGYSLMFLAGRNLAWFYDTSDAMFHGNIRLYYAFVWWPFGFVVESLWDTVITVIAKEIEPIHLKLILLVPLFMLLSVKFVGWPLLGIPRKHKKE